jgi:hypothetical protein
LSSTVTTLPEDTNVQANVADIDVADDGLGTNDLSLSGDDAALFEIIAQGQKKYARPKPW